MIAICVWYLANGSVQPHSNDEIITDAFYPKITFVHIPVDYKYVDGPEYDMVTHWWFRSDKITGADGPQAWHDHPNPVPHLWLYIKGDGHPASQFTNMEGSDTFLDNLEWMEVIDRINRINPGGVVEISDYVD